MSRFFNLFTCSFCIFAISICSITYVAIQGIAPSVLKNFDIVSFYTGGLIINKGENANLYNINTQYKWQRTISYQTKTFTKPFVNPPFVALFFSPFTRFPFNQIYPIFAFFNAGLFLIAFLFFIKGQAWLLKDNRYVFFFIFTLFYMPLYETLLQGQLSFFLFSGIIGSWYAFKHQRAFQAGIALSLFLIKPHLLCIPILLLIWKRQWYALIGLLVSASIVTTISLALVGFRSSVAYLQLLLKSLFNAGDYRMFPQTEPTLRGFLQYLSHTDSLASIGVPFVIGITLIGVIFFFIWKGLWNVKDEKFDIQWASLIIVVFLTSIHSYYYDFVLLLFPYLILLRSIRSHIWFYCLGISIDFVMLLFFLLGPWQSFFSLYMILLLGILAILSSRWYYTEAFVLGQP
ncbi:MAG TPA: glycosyltransferase family 87 protein [Candidatus Saccharimonadales bacterium]|nr:glycosyltransferase family 87 protein [Candidatus Saccharimonadales bacterium]